MNTVIHRTMNQIINDTSYQSELIDDFVVLWKTGHVITNKNYVQMITQLVNERGLDDKFRLDVYITKNGPSKMMIVDSGLWDCI